MKNKLRERERKRKRERGNFLCEKTMHRMKKKIVKFIVRC